MKKSRFTEAQISAALKEHELGKKVPDICRELKISQNTFYTWKRKYGGIDKRECLVIGDNYESDIKGSQSLCIDSIWINNKEEINKFNLKSISFKEVDKFL